MAILTGKICSTQLLGTGGEVCDTNEGQPTGFIIVPKGWFLSKTSGTFNKAYVDEQIQLGNFIPFTNAFSGMPTTPETTFEESPRGEKSPIRQGLTEYAFVYKKNYSFHKSAYSYNSTNLYDFLITYESEVIKVAQNPAGTQIKGFDGGYLNTDGWMENNGSVSAQTTTKFQLKSAVEVNQYGYFLESLDFLPSQLNGITDVVMTGTADVSDDRIVVTVSWLHNEQFPIKGLSSANFQVLIDGVEDTIVGVTSPSSGVYSIQPTATMTTSNAVIVKTYNDSLSNPVASAGVKFYKGETATITPVA